MGWDRGIFDANLTSTTPRPDAVRAVLYVCQSARVSVGVDAKVRAHVFDREMMGCAVVLSLGAQNRPDAAAAGEESLIFVRGHCSCAHDARRFSESISNALI